MTDNVSSPQGLLQLAPPSSQSPLQNKSFPPMLNHWSDTLLRVWDLFFGPIACVSNLTLLVLILLYTTKAMKTFSVFILMIAFSNAICGFTRIILSRRLFPTDIIIAMFQGFCEKFSDDLATRAPFCHFWYATAAQFLMLQNVLLLASYIYRIRLLTMPFDKFNRFTVHTLVYGYSLLHVGYFYWVYYMSLQPFEDIQKAVALYRPELINSTWTYYAIIYPEAPSQIVMNFATKTLVFITLLVAAVCQWRLTVNMRNFNYSDNIKQLHRAQINVLHAQTIDPLLTALSVLIFHAIKQVYASPLLENAVALPMLLSAIVSPVVTISVIKPYRMAFVKWCGVKPTDSSVVAPSSKLRSSWMIPV